MSSIDPDATAPELAPISTGPELQTEQTPPPKPAAVWVWVATLTAGLAAGLLSWFLAEPLYGRYRAEPTPPKGFPTIEQSLANELKAREGITLEASLVFATLGAVLGTSFGLAGGVARGSVLGAAGAGALGLVLGGLCGFGATKLLMKAHYHLYIPDENDLGVAVLIQGGIAAVVGAIAGGAFGLGLADGGRRIDVRYVTGGLLGAVAGLVVYQMVGGVAFPLDGTTLPVASRWTTRLFDQVAIAACAAVGVALAQGLALAPVK